MGLGFKTTFTTQSGQLIDLTPDCRNVEIIWPATTALPSVTAEFANGSSATNEFANIQSLAGLLSVTLPGELAAKTYNFYVEEPILGWDKTKGDIASFDGTGAPELLYSYEGLLSVVGTDLTAPYWNNLTGATFIPYPSTFVSSLGTNLLSVDTALTSLLHTPWTTQGQASGYRGRLNYEMGYGIPTTGIDYTPASLGGGPLYVKAMWTVGQGSQGSQKTGVDTLTSLLSQNIIDGNGAPQMIDWYVDISQNPTKLIAFQRASINSGVTIRRGVDAVEGVSLPYSSKDIRNLAVYYAPNETAYPNSGDAWSNYDTSPHLTSQWTNVTVGNAATLTADTNAYGNQGTSIKWTAGTSATSDSYSEFDICANGYEELYTYRGVTTIDFWLYSNNTSSTVSFQVYDAGEVHNAGGAGPQAVSASNTWQHYTLSFVTPSFFTTYSGRVLRITVHNPALSPAGFIQVDQLHFNDNWNFSPAYSWNPTGPSVTSVRSSATAGNTSLAIVSTAGLLVGQWITINFGGGSQERRQIATLGAQSVTIVSPDPLTGTIGLSSNHSVGESVIGGTDDPVSIKVFGPRPYPYSDFFLASGNSDTADSIGMSIINQRKAKKTTGTITVSGYQSGIGSILPGSIFTFIDPKTVYAPSTGNVDSIITGFIADSIRYIYDPQANGFQAEFTVEPWYSNILLTSPDANTRNIQRVYNMTPGGQIARLNRATQKQGVPF